MIGREREKDIIARCLNSKRPEFLVIYGRRRVGKTYLVKNYFKKRFSFYATGMSDTKTAGQLRAFNESLQQYGSDESTSPKDWFEAFSRLRKLLEDPNTYVDPASNKKVIFLDEAPWMDTARSDFRSALDYFWNSWASSQEDILLILCGSATSWIIDHILSDKGGFYNRVTMQIRLMPFTLLEVEKLFESNNVSMARKQIIESYMVFGGIPYYLNMIDERLSLAQNIDELILKETGMLHYEYERLFNSLFKHSEKHMNVINALSSKKYGLTRVELSEFKNIGEGEGLTKVLKELEQSGFIRKYMNYTKNNNGCIYQITDPFVLLCLGVMKDRKFKSWMTFVNSPAYYTWCGNAFETVCINHVDQIKNALGITGVESMEYAWKSKKRSGGAQIDLIIDRRDDMINLCEMKYTTEEFVIDEAYEKQLTNKLTTFREETSTKKTLHITMICAAGLKNNKHAHIAQNILTGEDLFG